MPAAAPVEIEEDEDGEEACAVEAEAEAEAEEGMLDDGAELEPGRVVLPPVLTPAALS